MLQPKKQKHRKHHRGRMRGMATKGTTLTYGEYGLKALEPCWITARQIESARIVIARKLQREGRLWIRVFPDKPVTATAAETRMGKGKGAIEKYVAVVKPGKVVFELTGVEEEKARDAVIRAAHKLPIRCKFVKREIL